MQVATLYNHDPRYSIGAVVQWPLILPPVARYQERQNLVGSREKAQNSTQRIGLNTGSVLRPRQHSIGHMGDGFYRTKHGQTMNKLIIKRRRRYDMFIV